MSGRWDELGRREQRLLQVMWEAVGILGFDLDGDSTPAAAVAGMGLDGFIEAFLRDVREARHDYDEALDLIP